MSRSGKIKTRPTALSELERAVWLLMETNDYEVKYQDETSAELVYIHNDPPHPVTHIEIRQPGYKSPSLEEARTKLTVNYDPVY